MLSVPLLSNFGYYAVSRIRKIWPVDYDNKILSGGLHPGPEIIYSTVAL